MKCSLMSLWLVVTIAPIAGAATEQWDLFEITLRGPDTGNPYVDVTLSATFQHETHADVSVTGFYDGGGTYRIRFMPPAQGEWTYTTASNIPALAQQKGLCEAVAPSSTNHGPVRVANTFHFAFADGTPFKPLGTTCYGWTNQPATRRSQTLATLAAAPFNKVRMCVFPKRYTWNVDEPPTYPFLGTPPDQWDDSQFNPAFFRNFEQQVAALRDLGIQADVILFHPYDKGHWGFDRMPDSVDDRYLRYVVSRLAAFRNVWWSLANEYDFMTEKQSDDWDRLFQILTASDPYHHLRSIHNGFQLYNHNHPWVTHASIQNGSAAEDAGRATLYRDVYRKPIVLDEIKYEGDIPKRWGNLSAEEMVHRFWQATIAGTYATHGECYLQPDDVLWWAKGGVLRGKSPPRLSFLKQILDDAPKAGINPIDKWQQTNLAGVPSAYYLLYLGQAAPTQWKFDLPQHGLRDGMLFRVELIDTWNMTISPVPTTFEVTRESAYRFRDKQSRTVQLPGKPWCALRIQRVPDDVDSR